GERPCGRAGDLGGRAPGAQARRGAADDARRAGQRRGAARAPGTRCFAGRLADGRALAHNLARSSPRQANPRLAQCRRDCSAAVRTPGGSIVANRSEDLRAMTSGRNATRKTITGLLMAGVAAAMFPTAVAAQDDETRLRRVEAEIRALQRVVFPGGDGRYFTPEVDTSQGQQQTPTVGTPTNTAMTDVLARLDALEAQL